MTIEGISAEIVPTPPPEPIAPAVLPRAPEPEPVPVEEDSGTLLDLYA